MRAYIPDYDLATPRQLSGALDLMALGDGWRPMAGGTDLMVLLNAGKLADRRLVSVRDIPEMRGIEATPTHVLIGAASTFTEIRDNGILQAEFPLLCQAASWSGGLANQNRGTLGGNIANASPAADSAPMLLVYEADVKLVSKQETRWVPYAAFHLAYKRIQMRSDELITCIRLPRPARQLRQYGRKVGTRKAQAISKVCFAGAAEFHGGTIEDIRLGLGSVAPIPIRCRRTEELLRGRELCSKTIDAAQQAILSEIQPITDIRSTSEYRTQVAVNLLREFLSTLQDSRTTVPRGDPARAAKSAEFPLLLGAASGGLCALDDPERT